MNKAFTLLEMIMVIFLIALLSAVLFLGRTKSEQMLALQRTAYQLAQDLREVQEMAMGAGTSLCGTHKFGIYFKQGTGNSYIIFADCNENCTYQPSDDETIRREVQFEKGVSYTLAQKLNIVFLPPDPKVYINSNDCLTPWGQEAEITLDHEGESKKVKINSAGRIEIE